MITLHKLNINLPITFKLIYMNVNSTFHIWFERDVLYSFLLKPGNNMAIGQDVVLNVVPDVVQVQSTFRNSNDSCICPFGKMWSQMWSRIIFLHVYRTSCIIQEKTVPRHSCIAKLGYISGLNGNMLDSML